MRESVCVYVCVRESVCECVWVGVCVCFEECFEEQLFKRLRIMIRMFYVKAMFLHKKCST